MEFDGSVGDQGCREAGAVVGGRTMRRTDVEGKVESAFDDIHRNRQLLLII